MELTQISKGFETMKSMLFLAIATLAMATTGCAVQSGGACNQQCGDDCMVLSGDCGCSAPKGLTPSGGLFCRMGDQRGMAMRLNQKGSACDQGRGSGLFSRLGKGQVAGGCSDGSCGGASDCGCSGAASAVISDGMMDGGCGCGDMGEVVVSDGGGMAAAGGAGGGLFGCRSGKCGLGLGGGGCLSGKCGLGLGGGAGIAGGAGIGGRIGAGGFGAGGCGMGGCGIGGKLCGGCLSKLAGAPRHPYGGAIPHTAQAQGAGTGMAPSYAYPYYTTRSPRDFLSKKPPTIGY